MSTAKHSDSWLSDDPRGGTSDKGEDTYNRRPFVDAVLKVLLRTREQSRSSVLALVGEWGSGKSTVLRILQAEMEKSVPANGPGKPWIVATFNPWLYSDLLSLQSGFFSELRAALPKEDRWKDARQQVRKWGKVVTPLASVAGVVGIDAAGATRNLIDSFAAFSPTATQLSAEKALEKRKQPILMILDDLDRLTAEELMQVFKLVRLVGRLPYVYYLLGYDEQTLVDLIKTTDLVPSDKHQRALDYLEKIVQVRLDLPPLLPQQVETVFYESVDELVTTHNILVDEMDLSRLRTAFDEVLSRSLRTPRSLSRFFGQVDAFLPEVDDDVDFVDFLLITWIRVSHPAVYALVQERRNEMLGGAGITLKNLTHEAPAAKKERWIGLLQEAGLAGQGLDDVLFLLAQLFPAMKRIRDAEKGPGYTPEPKPLRIAHLDYFDRYFSFGVPFDDLADSVVDSALSAIDKDERGQAFDRLQTAVTVDPPRILRKVLEKASMGQHEGGAVVKWLTEVFEAAPEWEPGFWGTRAQISAIVGVLFSTMSSADIAATIAAISVTETGLTLATRAVDMLRGKETGGVDEIKRWNTLGQSTNKQFEKLYEDLFKKYHDVEPQEIPDSAWYRIWDWQSLSPDAVRTFVATQIAEGRWSPLEVVARTVSVSVATAKGAVGAIMGFDLAQTALLVDIEEMKNLLKEDLANSPPMDDNWRHQSATPEHLRQFVLSYLRGVSDS